MTRASRERVRAVIRLEFLIQRREPLTVLYMLVFFLLAAAFAAAGPVELVRGRGSVPRDAAWSLMLASTALTAFGQVITTMVAATVVLRDRADCVDELLRATLLRSREYLTGKLLAALGLLCVIYTAIPVGLVCGAVLGGGNAWHALGAVLPPFLIIVVPTMLAVGAMQFGLGALSGRLWVIVGQGLLLIWLWTSAVDAVPRAGADLFVLLDPFASAPLLRASASWTDAQRATASMPLTAVLALNRMLWLLIGALVAGVAIVRAPQVMHSRGRPAAPAGAPRGMPPSAPERTWRTSALRAPSGSLVAWRTAAATAQYVLQWMLRDTGWRVLAALGTLNVAVHVAIDVTRGMSSTALTALVLSAIQLHAQLFLILLATIYAGEIVWREREDRSAAFFDALPIRDGDAVAGRIVGVFGAQCVLVLLMGAMAAATAMVRSRTMLAPGMLASGLSVLVLLPFIAWMLLALAVHVVVQQKVVAHLACIVGWMVVVRVRGSGAVGAGAADVSWSVAFALLAAMITSWLGWVRGTASAPLARWRMARRRLLSR